jgi:hypothetical protein
VNARRVVGWTLLALGVVEAVGCLAQARTLALGHPVFPVLCAFFTFALLGSGWYVLRVARRNDR